MTPLVRVENAGRDYPVRGGGLWSRTRRLTALDGVSFTVAEGEVLGVVGESGCGKSTLARVTAGLEPVTRGVVRVAGKAWDDWDQTARRRLRPRIQPVFQDPLGSLNPRFTASRTLDEPLQLHAARSRHTREELLALVGLGPEILTRYPHQLSGGQRQRLSIARSLASRPDLVIADEPLSSLDVSIQAQLINLFARLRRELNFALIFITHDLRVVSHLADHVMVMYLGRVMELAPVSRILASPAHPYTRALFSALPRLKRGRGRKRAVLRGELPTPIEPEPGCRFRGRCPFRREVCDDYENVLLPVADGHHVGCLRWQDVPQASPVAWEDDVAGDAGPPDLHG